MQKDDSQANLPIKSPFASPLDEILKRLGRMQNDLVNQVSGQAGYTVEEKFADAVPAKMSLQYVRGRDLIQNALPERKLSPADLKAIEVYRRIHNELPAKLPFYNKDTLSRDIDILVSGKARAVQNAQQAQQALKADKASIAKEALPKKSEPLGSTKIDHSQNRPVERSNTDKTAIEKPALQRSQGSKPWQASMERFIERPPATAPLLQKISFIREMRKICDTASGSSSEMHVRPRGNLDTPVVISRLVQSLYRANIERHPALEQLARIFKDKDIDRFQSKYDGFAVLRLVPRPASKQDKVHADLDRGKPFLIVARLKGDYKNPLWHVAKSERFESYLLRTRPPRAIPISVSHTVKCFTSGTVTLQRYFGQPRAERMRLMMTVADLFHRTQPAKNAPVKPNHREMPIYKSAMALRIFEAPAKIKVQLPHKADYGPGQVSGGEIRIADSRSQSSAKANSAKAFDVRFSQAAGDKVSQNTVKQYFAAQCNRIKSDRYIGSADVTFVLVFALAVAAKNRLNDDESGSNLNIYQRLESQYTLADGQAMRPVLRVREGDTIDGIARELFNNASVAHLIADLNMAAIQEEYLEGKRIIRLKERQQLRLPLLEDINAYFAGKYHKIADKAELVTIVESSQIDDEAVYEHLARILSGADKNIKQVVQTIPGESSTKKDKEWFDSPAIYRKALIKNDLISTVAEDDNHFEIQDGDRIVDYKQKPKGNRE